jgi:fatty acid desaturase
MTATPNEELTDRLARRRQKRLHVEWPTLLVMVGCYALWFASGIYLYALTPGLALVMLGIAIALHSSLQHEVLHGHPTRYAKLNEALVFLPLGLFYPYRSYKRLHLQHHADERLTDPYDDPESYYRAADDWTAQPPILKTILSWNNTLLGRVTLGPPLMVFGFIVTQWRSVLGGDTKVALAWAIHVAGLVPTVLIIEFAFGIPIWLYALTSAYLGIALIAVRSFCEHQWSERADGRTIIVERSVLAPLFLNNNLHFVHHKLPTVPWYLLPALYHERREDWLAMNEGYVFRSYFDVIKAFSFRAKEPVVHPALRCGEARMTVRIEEATPIFSFADEIPVPEMR